MSNLSGFVKRLRDIMRNDAGINGDAQRIEQIAWMLFLKVYDAKEQDWEWDEEDYQSIIPEPCRWANWAHDDKSGNEGSGIGAAMLGLGLPRAPGIGTLAAHGALCRCAGSGALGCMGLRRLIAKAEGGAGVLAEFVQVPEHLRGALIALVQIGGHGVHGDLLQALGNLGI